MAKIWILAAESSRANIYALESRIQPLIEVESFAHSEGRALVQDMTSDQPGRSFDSNGLGGRHAVGKEVDPKHHEAQIFAKRLADRLDEGRTHGSFDELILIAPPAFLGLLRESLNAQTSKLVGRTLDKNLVQAGEQSIREHLFE